MAAQYKVVCYYGAWATDRKAPMSFAASDVPAEKCTHVIYSFAGLDDGGKIVSLNPELDIAKGDFLRKLRPAYMVHLFGFVR